MQFEFLTVDRKPCPPDQQPVFFGFECPRNQGQMCTGLIIRDNPAGLHVVNSTWAWDGNRESPTFSPSIYCKGCSHGHIANGKWTDA